VERRVQLVDAGVTVGQPGQDGAAGRVGERGQGLAQAIFGFHDGILN